MTSIRRRSRADRRQGLDETHFPATERRASAVRDLQITVERKSDAHVILHFRNEFIVHNSCLLDEQLERLSPHLFGTRIELEMSHVPYADSDALGRLADWSKKLSQAGASLIVVNPTPYVTGIMEMLHLDSILAIVRRHTFPKEEK